MINEIRIFSPATVSNVACGFDVLGFALESIGDEMIVRKTTQKGLTINNVSGFDLPMDIKKNVANDLFLFRMTCLVIKPKNNSLNIVTRNGFC